MAKRMKLSIPKPRNPVAREMIVSGRFRSQSVPNKKRATNRAKVKAQDRKDLGAFLKTISLDLVSFRYEFRNRSPIF